MKIAVYVDGAGEVTSFFQDGLVRLYDNESGAWVAVADAPLDARPGMSLAAVKAAVRAMVPRLGGCTVFLSADVRGLINSILQEEFGVHTWKSHGPLMQQLDTVAEKEVVYAAQKAKEAAEAACAPKVPASGCCGGGGGGYRHKHKGPPPAAEQVAPGRYRFDLAGVLAADPNLNSRLALIPVMEGTPFESLEILCDHIPRWFSQKLADLRLKAEIEPLAHGVRAMVFPDRPGGATQHKDA